MALKPPALEDLQRGISELLARSPAADVERNVKALLSSAFDRLDLVTREEFDLQAQMLARAREQLQLLEARVAELERQRGSGG